MYKAIIHWEMCAGEEITWRVLEKREGRRGRERQGGREGRRARHVTTLPAPPHIPPLITIIIYCA